MSRYCRICRNTSCNNHGKNISFLGEGWQCNYIPVPTNADRIRAMGDEELANIMAGTPICKERYMDCLKDGRDCETCLLEWLKQPAE